MKNLFLIFLFPIASCLSAQNPSKNIEISSQKSTFLYGKEASKMDGKLELVGGNRISWEGNGQLEWEIDVPEKEVYEIYLITSIRSEVAGEKLFLKTDKKTYNFELAETKGPFKTGRNYQRVLLSPEIALKKGKQKITLLTEGISKESVLFDIRSLELLPVSAKDQIEAERARAITSRVNVEWLQETGYGLMFHWTSECVQPDGSQVKYEDAVNDFDVKSFADMVEETGAGYVYFPIGHAESYCPAPIKSWEKIHPGHTTQRDLIAELADALNAKGIPFLCYVNGPLAFNLSVKTEPNQEEKQAFVANFKNILGEIGMRYKDKIAGYWFDSWYQIFEVYPEVPFEEFNQAVKVGNQDRVFCLNSWIFPPVTQWQDYWAGEAYVPIALPENEYMKGGPAPDLPYQVLITMEPGWVQKKAPINEPHIHSENLGDYIQDCIDNGGIVTVNMGIDQAGNVGEKALQIMREVKEKIRK